MTWWKRLRDWMTGTSSFDGQGRVAVSPAPTSSRAPGSVSLTENDGDTIRGPVRGASNNDRIIRVPERSLFDDPEALMTPQDVRRRFMALRRGGIFPHHHPNEIPSRTDEFTRLIDRAMVLAGFLTDTELKEIHEISETWLKHKKTRLTKSPNRFFGRLEALDFSVSTRLFVLEPRFRDFMNLFELS
ncbi:MAG: hypothetical protein AAFV29_25645, partial [Myxococcota bacterium]